MKQFSKGLAFFINLANYGVGIAVTVILLFKLDFISIFYLYGMTSNESLFFNMAIFICVLLMIGIVLNLLINEFEKTDKTFEFPIVFEIIPAAISIINIIFAFKSSTAREKIIVIAVSVLYAVFSAGIIYSGTRIFQIFPKESKK